MELPEIRGKDSRELRLDLHALRKELFGLRFRGASEEVRNTSRFRQIRRTIARIYTVLGQRGPDAVATAAATAPAGETTGTTTKKKTGAPKRTVARGAAKRAKTKAAAAKTAEANATKAAADKKAAATRTSSSSPRSTKKRR